VFAAPTKREDCPISKIDDFHESKYNDSHTGEALKFNTRGIAIDSYVNLPAGVNVEALSTLSSGDNYENAEYKLPSFYICTNCVHNSVFGSDKCRG
jgi:hypothetical protein